MVQDDAEDAGGRRPEARADRIRDRQSPRLGTRLTRDMREARQQQRQARMQAERQAAEKRGSGKQDAGKQGAALPADDLSARDRSVKDAPTKDGPAAAAAGPGTATAQANLPAGSAGSPVAGPSAETGAQAAATPPPAAGPTGAAAPQAGAAPAGSVAGQGPAVPAKPPAPAQAQPSAQAPVQNPAQTPGKAGPQTGPQTGGQPGGGQSGGGQPGGQTPGKPLTPPAPRPPAVQSPVAAPQGAKPPAKPAAQTNAWTEAMAAIEVRPVAQPARMRRRHWGLIASFFGVVLLPLLVVAAYLWFWAEDQYASTVGFTVRQEETASAGALAGGLAQILGGSGTTGANTRVLYEYIQSRDLVTRVQGDLDLIGHYARSWPGDPVYSIWPDATIEELTRFWLRMVRISYDELSGLIEVQVRAHDAPFAQAVAERIVDESQEMINQLNAAARRDGLAWAQADLDQAVARLRAAREALTTFRATTQIVDPAADIQGRMGILTSLQQQLAQALVDHDLLTATDEADPRRRQMQRRIDVIRDRITQERQSFAAQDVTISDTDYPTLIARFESLLVDQEVAQATYLAAQAALDGARSRAERQTLYLATYIRPTQAQKSEYPDRPVLTGLAGFFLLMLWSVLALVYYSLRDRG